MSLEQWQRNGWLLREDAKLAEIIQLFAVVDRELSDAKVPGLSADGRFMHAYVAALQLCMVALRASGYRIKKGEGHHKHAIGSLPFTLGSSFREASDQIEIASRKRGHAMYDHANVVTPQDAEDLIATVRQLRRDVVTWLKQERPKLVPHGM